MSLCEIKIQISKRLICEPQEIDKSSEQKKLEKPLNEKIIAVKKIIEDNPDDNYSLVLKEFGQEFVDHNIAIGTFFELSKGKQLVFIVGGW